MLAVHSAAGYRERGLGVTLRVGAQDQEGLSARCRRSRSAGMGRSVGVAVKWPGARAGTVYLGARANGQGTRVTGLGRHRHQGSVGGPGCVPEPRHGCVDEQPARMSRVIVGAAPGRSTTRSPRGVRGSSGDPVWCNKAAEVGESAKQGRCEWLLPQ